MRSKYDLIGKKVKPAKQVFHIDPERHLQDQYTNKKPIHDSTYITIHTLYHMWQIYTELIHHKIEAEYRRKRHEHLIHITYDDENKLGRIPDYVIDIYNSPYSKDLLSTNQLGLKVYNWNDSYVVVTENIFDIPDLEPIPITYPEYRNCQWHNDTFQDLVDYTKKAYAINPVLFINAWYYANAVVFFTLKYWYEYIEREKQTLYERDKRVKESVDKFRKTVNDIFAQTRDTIKQVSQDIAASTDITAVDKLKTDYLYAWHTKLLDSLTETLNAINGISKGSILVFL